MQAVYSLRRFLDEASGVATVPEPSEDAAAVSIAIEEAVAAADVARSKILADASLSDLEKEDRLLLVELQLDEDVQALRLAPAELRHIFPLKDMRSEHNAESEAHGLQRTLRFSPTAHLLFVRVLVVSAISASCAMRTLLSATLRLAHPVCLRPRRQQARCVMTHLRTMRKRERSKSAAAAN